MQKAAQSRRTFLRLLTAVAGAAAGLVWGSGAAVQYCYKPSQLSPGDKSLRQSMQFEAASSDPARRCGGCAFFSQAELPDCGSCMLFSGGPVSVVSVCDSWVAKS